MIVDIPTGDDFRRGGVDLLNLAWDSVIGLLLYLNPPNIKDEDPSFIHEITDDFWKAASTTVSSALALTQQGAEFLLKGLICEVSAFLLIANELREWPGSKRDQSFAEFKTIDAADLPTLHDSIRQPSLPAEFNQKFRELRVRRNTFLHTVSKKLRVEALEVIVNILEMAHYLVGPRQWLTLRHTYLGNTPESVLFSRDFVESRLIDEALLCAKLLTRSDLETHFGFVKGQRVYICPYCSIYRTDPGPHSAQLQPNLPSSTTLWCFICDSRPFVIQRWSCQGNGCEGNVIFESEGRCLSCGLANQDQ